MNAARTLLTLALLGSAGTLSATHGSDSSPPVHMRGDLNRDYQTDIFFSGGTALAYWQMAGNIGAPYVAASRYAGDAGAGFRLVAINDFDGDRAADVLWSDGSYLKLWLNDGKGSFTPVPVAGFGGGWQPFAAGDINADGRADIVFRGGTHLAYWLMAGAQVIRSSYAGNGGEGYRVVDIADLTGRNPDGSRSVDVLWTNGSHLKAWVSDNTTSTFTPYALGTYGGGWEPFAAGDVSGDRTADIMFRGSSHLAYWELQEFGDSSGFRYASHYAGDGGPGFRAIAVDEFGQTDDQDLLGDVLWSNGSQIRVWLGRCDWTSYDWDYGCSRHDFVSHLVQQYGGGWQPVEMLIPPG